MLIYVGEGNFLPGIPARDLTDEEVKQYDEHALLASKLYQKPAAETKMVSRPAENK